MSVQLATVDPAELGELLVEAWRQTAAKRLVTAYDAGSGRSGRRGSMRPWRLGPARFR